MFWDWLYRTLHWREIQDDLSELDAMMEGWAQRQAELDARIRANFTEEEWAEVAARCEKKLAEYRH